MECTVSRQWNDITCSMGRFAINGAPALYWTLELPAADPRRIPAGRYQLSKYQSPKFQNILRDMRGAYPEMAKLDIDWVPRVMGSPTSSWDEIHMGNTVEDVKGCCILGMDGIPSAHFISSSRYACAEFYVSMDAALRAGEPVWINFGDGENASPLPPDGTQQTSL